MSQAQRRIRSKRRARIVFVLGILALTLATAALAEASLQVLARSVTSFERVIFPHVPMMIPDPQLVRRGNPKFFDHDEHGFRNPKGVTRAAIVTIGDSHTYGVSVQASEAWPRVLERLSGCRVYNMGVSTYGPLQYTELARDSTRLQPRLIVVGIYFGNDLSESWQRYLADPTRYAVPDALLRPATELENESPLRRRVIDFYTMGAGRDLKPNGMIVSSARQLLSDNSALWGFFRAAKLQLVGGPATTLDRSFQSAVSSLTPQQLAYASVFEGGGWRTIFTAGYRMVALDAADPRIVAGRWLTERAIEDIASVAHSIGATVLVVLLPTKESVFAPKVGDLGAHEYLEQLVRDEAVHRRHMMDFLTARKIAHVDASRALGSLQGQPFYENADGHPNPRGHEAIANAVKAAMPSCS